MSAPARSTPATAAEDQRRQATVKWFNPKGYGFLIDSNDEDVFVHHNEIVSDDSFKMLATGQLVEYDEYTTEKGLSASRVILLK